MMMIPENKDKYDNEGLVKLIKAIDDGSDLDSIFNVDSFLKYLAVSTITLHSDSYQGAMYHHYYLYNNDGVFEWIAWDLNMIFNGFDASGLTDLEATKYLIDDPVTGAMSKYPLIEAIFKNEEYVEQYHEYLKTDTTAFYSYEEFENALFIDEDKSLSLVSFEGKRVANVAQQLSGDIASTNDGEGNSGYAAAGGMGQKPEGVEEDANGDAKAVPEAMDGEMPERPARPENVDGGGMQDEAVNKEVTVESSTNTTRSTTDITIIVSMVVLTIGVTVYLSKNVARNRSGIIILAMG
ncbi:CotH kinase family protein [Clostridium sp.]|uniref:CotH kinase family protein n=1 Tax=Clostridium sp. TaxID=1506 RepID=UPI0025BFB1A0|nr:CotH kinase family protein [Clostridium sp.]